MDTPQGQATFNITSREDGFYRVENLIPGEASVTVKARSSDAELRRTVTADLRGGHTTRVDVDFGEGASIAGEITNFTAHEVGQVFAIAGHDDVDVSTAEAVREACREDADEVAREEGRQCLAVARVEGVVERVALLEDL